MESVPFTEQDCDRLDAFQYRGLRKILNIKHPFWSRVKNKDILEMANTRAKTKPDKQIIPVSQRLVHRQIKLYGHIIRADDLDLMKSPPCTETVQEGKPYIGELADPDLNGTQSPGSIPLNT